MKTMRKTGSLLLALILLLCGCSETTAEESAGASSNEAESAETAAEETAEEAVDEKLAYDPKLEAVDYGGADFAILYEEGSAVEPNNDFRAEELTGEILNDAIYNRTVTLEEKYDLVMSYLSAGNVTGQVSTSVSAGDSAYDAVDANAQFCIQMGSKGQLLEVHSIPFFDFSKPYWNELTLKGSSIAGKNYFTFSDINIHAYGATPCMIFNKVVHENFQLPSLYELVLNGKWTFDRACEMISAVTTDADGDGQITKDDVLGLIANNFCVDCFISGTGYQMISKDENDLPVLDVFTEELADLMDGIKRVCSAETGTFLVDRTSTATEAREYWTEQAITEDRALFWVGNIKCVERMRASESDFGVVPMPKGSEAQENYAIHVQANVGTVLCYPITVTDPERLGRVIEDMAYLSFCEVMPAYMDVCIDGKTVRDTESLDCLEIIRSSYYCDLGFMCQQMGVNILNNMRDYVTNNKTDYMSSLNASKKVWSKCIEKLGQTFSENE